MNMLIFEIDALRQKLELMISGNKTEILSEKTIMECSQRLDDLITLYYRQISSTPENTNKYQV